jgi:hypothetical protein
MEKKLKLGRPPVKNKMTAYTFTLRENVRTDALCKAGKELLDEFLRKKVTQYAKK